MSILDISIVVVILFFLLNGYRKGILKDLFSLIGLAGSLVIAFYFSSILRTFLDSFSLTDTIYNQLYESVFSSGGIFDITLTDANLVTTVQDGLVAIGIPLSLLQPLLNFLTELNRPLGEALAYSITELVMVILSFVSLFILSRIVLSFVFGNLSKSIKTNKVLSSLDRILGLVFGALKGSVFIFVGFTALIGLSLLNQDLNTWMIDQLQLNTDAWTLSKTLYEWVVEFVGLTLA
jgi:uncharacterized membrane protein required for colicin V production